ncbi:monofunctional chorismate mutase, clade 1 [Halobacteroides halobius DSM 5150]|uniref:chorismate mutase n=1 Tax=Halobacteroides halobius (strain ATCC 35273 / DSM 5150 / MD-1) TaxID=748449 RepID=L0KAH2_HALHC|nr:chorismate mutase [Halobacteroides halobius]AGB41354.1 monofunctional chorismate mutase, clade 1 [Halobacteroides halobius DSM 5150]
MKVRGIRGAITVEKNSSEQILSATQELLQELEETNDLKEDNVASVIFSMTPDLDQAFPAQAAREMGWNEVPLFCTQELAIEGALAKCIRILIHYNTEKALTEINHIYLKAAKELRPDLIEKGGE